MKVEEINIGTITDKNYIQHTGAWAFSILKNCSTPSRVHFYMFESDLDDHSRELFNSLCKNFDAKVTYLRPDNKLFESLTLGSHLPRIIYCKLLFPDKLKKINKIIVLDSDLVFEGDIVELWNFPLNGKTVAAVPDAGVELQEMCKRKMGIPAEKEYLNSGVMLIDCKKWRKKKVMLKVIRFIKENPEKISVQDQDGLNYVLQDDWVALPYEWNVIHPFYYNSIPLKRKLGIKEFDRIRKNPKVIHYTVKPWKFDKAHPKRDRYWYYLKQTPWEDYKYPDKNFKNLSSRILRVMIRPLPWEVKVRAKEILENKVLKRKIRL